MSGWGRPKLKGWVKLLLNGKLVHEGNNLVVDAGLELMADLLAGSTTDTPRYSALGSGATTPAPGQTALVSEIANSRVLGSPNATGNTFTLGSTTGATGTWTVRECGLFTAIAGGTMFARFTFPQVTMTAGDILSMTWTIEVEP